MKSGQVGVGSNIAQNHSFHLQEVMVIISLNSYDKLTKIKIMSIWSRFDYCSKSLLEPLENHIWPLFVSIHLTSWPNVKSGQVGSRFEHCSKSLIWPLGSHLWSLFTQIHMKSWPNSKLRKVGVGSNIAQNHSSSL